MNSQPEHVLVVGSGLGGLRTVEQLRAVGYEGRISLVGEETHAPYDRPPLSKQLLAGTWEPDRVVLRDPASFDELGVRGYLGTRAVALRPGEVELSDGATLHADAIVVATGLVARRFPGQPDRVHSLRTLDDSLALRAALADATSLLVIGGGFIGAEVASTAHDRGIDVTVLEALDVPFARALGDVVGALCGRLVTDSGVTLRTGARLAKFIDDDGSDGRVRVELTDGTRFDADVALVGIGGAPQLDWLHDTGIDIADGLACDATGRVHGLDGVWAVGDIAAWDDGTGRTHRHEHWSNAVDQAAVVAAAIAGAEPPPPAVPYFWSDQFGLKIQLIGRPDGADETVALHGDGLTNGALRGTVVGYLADGKLIAVAGLGAARLVARYRALLSGGADRAATLEFARSMG